MHSAVLLIEFGSILLGLGLLGRAAGRFKFSPIPLYLLAGLAFGKGGLLPLGASEEFVGIGAEIGVILLLLMLGLEYTAGDLVTNLRAVQWVITGYSLVLAAFTITGGRLGDMFGCKRLFMIGAVIFAVGSSPARG